MVPQLRSVGRLRAGRKLQAEVEALSWELGEIKGHMATEEAGCFPLSRHP